MKKKKFKKVLQHFQGEPACHSKLSLGPDSLVKKKGE